MKIFTCGPVAMFPAVQKVRERDVLYFRSKEYGQFAQNILSRLSSLLGNCEKQTMIPLACSGTGAMESAIENCVSPEDRVLVINGGGFGQRWCDLLKFHNVCFESINLKWDEELSEETLKPYFDRGFTMLFVNLDETTSGKLYNSALLHNFCKDNGMMLVVDAISSFLVDDFEMDKSGMDLVLFSSQKGLCCSPGCSFISVSQRMKEKIFSKKSYPSTFYFSYRDYFNNVIRGQTPFTPTVMIMYEIDQMLNLIKKSGGKKEWIKSIEKKATAFRNEASARGYTVPSYSKSNMLTPLLFSDFSAFDFTLLLRKRGYCVTPCGGELSEILLRVGHCGNTTEKDGIDLLDAMDEVRREVVK